MARKLPWTTTLTTTTTTASTSTRITEPNTPRRAKRQKTAPIAEETELQSISRAIKDESSDVTPRKARARTIDADQRQVKKRRDGRSPSTSPPPGPPEIEFMYEGLDGDDVYAMVEDEFYATAQGYTAHLHHAEYKRLMREAKERKRLDTVLKIPEDATPGVKDKLKRKTLEERQSSGVKSMNAGLIGMEADEDQAEEDHPIDHFAGTSLAGLMRWNSQERTSLKGLEKISGATRAAQGFESNRTRESEGKGDELVEAAYGVKEKISERTVKSNGATVADVNAPRVQAGSVSRREQSVVSAAKGVIPSSISSGERNSEATLKSRLAHSPSSLNTRIQTDEKSTTQAPKSYKSLIDSLDDFDDRFFDKIQAQTVSERAVPSDKPRIKQEKGVKSPRRDKKSRYDEIPVFLID